MSRQRSAIEWQDIVAATFVVGTDLIECDYLSIQEAFDNLRPAGGSVYVLEGTYDELLAYPVDTPIDVFGSGQSTVLAPTTAGSVLRIPDGLTKKRVYVVKDLQINGNPAVAQTGFQVDDANNYGDFELQNVNGGGLQRFAHWTQYDTSYTRQSCIFMYNSVFQAISGGSIIVTAPNAAGNYLAAIAIRASEASSFTPITDAGVVYAWTADADADLWVSGASQQLLALAPGISMNGFLVEDTTMFFYGGAGSASFGGNGWGENDYIRNMYSGAFDASGTVLVDFLLNINGAGVNDSVFYYGVNCTFIACVEDCQLLDPIDGSAHPAVQVNNNKSIVSGTIFRNLSGSILGFPQGCVKLVNSVKCKVHHNYFETTLVGKTIIETGSSDVNVIDGNTGENVGTGLTIIGPSTTVNGALKASKSAASTAALVTAVSLITNPLGLQGVGWVKNTGGANSIDVKESFTDAFGTTSTKTTTVTFGNTLQLSLGIAIGTGLPPYVSYKVEVVDTVAASHSTYEVQFTSQGATL